jgi:Ala-tRNA(Pro) deacylase
MCCRDVAAGKALCTNPAPIASAEWHRKTRYVSAIGRPPFVHNANANPRKQHRMPVTREELFAHLEKLGFETQTVEHPAVFTVAESERLERDIAGGHTKNLFLKDTKGRIFLIIAQSHTKVDLKQIHKAIGCTRLSFGKPDLMMEVLGVEPGSVTALAVINDRDGKLEQVIFDEALMAYDTVNCHPLVNTATTAIARDDLLAFIRSCGHEPRIMPLNIKTP